MAAGSDGVTISVSLLGSVSVSLSSVGLAGAGGGVGCISLACNGGGGAGPLSRDVRLSRPSAVIRPPAAGFFVT